LEKLAEPSILARRGPLTVTVHSEIPPDVLAQLGPAIQRQLTTSPVFTALSARAGWTRVDITLAPADAVAQQTGAASAARPIIGFRPTETHYSHNAAELARFWNVPGGTFQSAERGQGHARP
jgi:hypothetical protein